MSPKDVYAIIAAIVALSLLSTIPMYMYGKRVCFPLYTSVTYTDLDSYVWLGLVGKFIIVFILVIYLSTKKSWITPSPVFLYGERCYRGGSRKQHVHP